MQLIRFVVLHMSTWAHIRLLAVISSVYSDKDKILLTYIKIEMKVKLSYK